MIFLMDIDHIRIQYSESSNKKIARLGYMSMTDYYLKVRVN